MRMLRLPTILRFERILPCLSPWKLTSSQSKQSLVSTWNRVHRKLIGRLRRLSRWEFWPPYLFYPPVFAYIAYLGIRFRSWTLFTAANPAIPAGGFVGKSKHQILEHLQNADPWLPRFTLLDSVELAQRVAQAEDSCGSAVCSFPSS